MANSMKSSDVIQEVKILPRVTASHRPGSGTRWQEETNVRSRGKQVGRPCIEPRNRIYFVVQNARPRTGKGINKEKIKPIKGIKTAAEKMTSVAMTPVAISFDNPL